MHTKHCSSDHNTSRDLEFDKNVPRLETTGATNLKKKQSEGNTLLCYEYLFYINTQVQVLKSFNSLLIYKSSLCQHREQIARIFFPAHCTSMNFFFGRWSCAGFFFHTHIRLQDIFFFKINRHTPPPPPKLNGWPLT